jgi:hypothetical protein
MIETNRHKRGDLIMAFIMEDTATCAQYGNAYDGVFPQLLVPSLSQCPGRVRSRQVDRPASQCLDPHNHRRRHDDGNEHMTVKSRCM